MILFPILFYLFLAVVNLRLAAFVLIFLLSSYLWRFNIGPLPTTFLEVMIIILTFVWLIKIIKNRKIKESWQNFKKIVSTPTIIIIGLFLFSATMAIFIAPNFQSALGIWKAYFVEPIILFFIFLNIFSKRDIPKILFSLALSALFISALAIIQKFTGWLVPYTFWGKDNVFRVTSFYGFPNAIGLYLAPLVPIFIFHVFALSFRRKSESRKKLKNFLDPDLSADEAGLHQDDTRQSLNFYQVNVYAIIFCVITILLSLLAIIWANSSGALVAILIGLILTGLFNKKTFFPAIILIIICSSLIFFNILPKDISNTLLLEDWSGQVRIKMWTETISMLKDNFIFGAGLSGYPTVVAPYHLWSFVEIFQYPHNFILTFWSEIGLLGLLSFLALSFIYLKNIINNLKNNSNPWLFYGLLWSFLVILIHGLVDVPYFKNDLAILFWLIISLLFINNKIQEGELKK